MLHCWLRSPAYNIRWSERTGDLLLTLPVAEMRPCIPPWVMGLPVTQEWAFMSPWPELEIEQTKTVSRSPVTAGVVHSNMTMAHSPHSLCTTSTLWQCLFFCPPGKGETEHGKKKITESVNTSFVSKADGKAESVQLLGNAVYVDWSTQELVSHSEEYLFLISPTQAVRVHKIKLALLMKQFTARETGKTLQQSIGFIGILTLPVADMRPWMPPCVMGLPVTQA